MARKTTSGSESGNRIVEDGDGYDSSIIDGDVITGDGIDSANDGQDNGAINPGDILRGSESGDGEQPRTKRKYTKRNSGGGKRASKETSQDLSGVLFSIHLMMASTFKVEELAIDPDEAKRLSDAMARVNELYDGFVIPEKTLAWISLAMAMGGVYGPRVAAYNIRMKEERKKTITVTPTAVH